MLVVLPALASPLGLAGKCMTGALADARLARTRHDETDIEVDRKGQFETCARRRQKDSISFP
jgi:hypothetical protein